MKFKIGDKVIVPERNDQTGIIADMIGDLEDGLITFKHKAVIEGALFHSQPLTVQGIEDGGYILGIGKAQFSGIIFDDALKPYAKPTKGKSP